MDQYINNNRNTKKYNQISEYDIMSDSLYIHIPPFTHKNPGTINTSDQLLVHNKYGFVNLDYSIDSEGKKKLVGIEILDVKENIGRI